MARSTKSTTRSRIASTPKAGRPAAKPKKAAAKTPAAKAKKAKSPIERAPVVTKDELRAQVEKLEQTMATLRAKAREANRASKLATVRVAELEEEVARLEKQAASQAASAERSATRLVARERRTIDPGDGVPPGVAVAEPEPLDEEAKGALKNLEEHIGESS